MTTFLLRDGWLPLLPGDVVNISPGGEGLMKGRGIFGE
jgi:hypothetical protein